MEHNFKTLLEKVAALRDVAVRMRDGQYNPGQTQLERDAVARTIEENADSLQQQIMELMSKQGGE